MSATLANWVMVLPLEYPRLSKYDPRMKRTQQFRGKYLLGKVGSKSLELVPCTVALVVKNPSAKARNVRGAASIPLSAGSPGAGNGNWLQCSCLENFTDWGAWQATVHAVEKTQRWLNDSHTHTHIFNIHILLVLLLWRTLTDTVYTYKVREQMIKSSESQSSECSLHGMGSFRNASALRDNLHFTNRGTEI